MTTLEVRARLLSYRLGLVRPVVTSKGLISHRSGFIVELSDGECLGYGDAAPLLGWSFERIDQVEEALAAWSTHHDGFESSATIKSVHGAGAIADAQVSLRAARAGLPLHQFLQPGSNRTIETNALVSAAQLNDLAEEVAAALDAGYSTLKLKVAATSVAEDIERTRLVRAALGPDGKLRVDANGGWSASEAIDALRGLSPFEIEYCEDPVASVSELPELRRRIGVPIAVDHLITDRGSMDTIVAENLTDFVVLKPALLGGAVATVDVARRCQAAGLGVVVTSFIDSVVGRTVAAHVAASVGAKAAHGTSTGHLLAADIAADPSPEGPTVVLSPEPGLGLDLSALAALEIAP